MPNRVGSDDRAYRHRFRASELGDYFDADFVRDLKDFPLFTPEEEREWIARAQAGPCACPEDRQTTSCPPCLARHRVIGSNLRLVMKLAREHAGMGVDVMDLVSVGTLGLEQAIDRFDLERRHEGKPLKFSTYAYWWIRKEIYLALRSSNGVKLPPEWNLKQLGYSSETKRRASILSGIARFGDLEASLPEGVGFDVQANVEQPDEAAARAEERARIWKALQVLDGRERAIIVARWGLTSGERQTLAKVAQQFDVTPERIRQIEERAKVRMRIELEKKPA